MARISKKKEDYVIAANDIEADIRLEVINAAKGDIALSTLGFGTEFSNWKNFVTENNLEKTKKEFYPKLGSILTHYSGDRYKVNDVKVEYIQFHPKMNDANPDTTYNRPVYVVEIEKIN